MHPRGPAPRPYGGHRIDRHERLGAPWSTDVYDEDRSGARTYRFNALGHRGDDFRADARLHVFVFGESDAFGLGIEHDETWGHRAAHAEARRLGVPPGDVCVSNFADCGLSTDAAVRELLVQCAAFRPDLVLFQTAPPRRADGVLGGAGYPIGRWHGSAESARTAREAPLTGGLRPRLREQSARARAFLRFCDDEQGLLQTVRALLLAQSFLRAEGLRGVAIAREPGPLVSEFAREHGVIGPLLELLDRRFFRADVSLAGGAEPAARGEHPGARAHAAAGAAVARHLADGCAEDVAAPNGPDAGAAVRASCTELPLDAHGTLESAAEAVRRPTVERRYPDLHALLMRRRSPPRSALEVGCGAGWLSNALALHYGAAVDAIDLTPAALERARAVAAVVGTGPRTRFRECDALSFASAKRYDLAVSLGVLHHTGDARRGFARMVRHVAPAGHVYVGLHHGPARRIFLEEMWRIAETSGEDAAFERYLALEPVHADDPTLARSWFRDHVLHPRGTQHTLEEVCGWLDELGLVLVSTSLAGFGPAGERSVIADLDAALADRSRRALFEEERYFPGDFTFLARRVDTPAWAARRGLGGLAWRPRP